MPLPLSPSVFEILRGLIEERAGLHYGPADQEIFRSKLSERAVELGFESLLDYYYFLRYDPAGGTELALLTDHLVVNETYFFREAEQLDFVVNELLAPRVAAGERPRLWSAACSTGEEPLSIAMLLAARDLLGKVDLLASDISERALAAARRGHYRSRSMRQEVARPEAKPWLTRLPSGDLVTSPRLIEAVTWRRLNLLDREAVTSMGPCDVVLCRNVLIYFNEQTCGQVVDHLATTLAPGGTLLVGISESLLRFGTSLECEERAGVFFYHRKEG
jgi:chemotaxis protein methyltransferase CheR